MSDNLLIFLTAILFIGVILLLYGAYIEPKMLYKRRYEIKSPLLTSHEPIKIVHFTDVHAGQFLNVKRLEKIVAEINRENPHIVVFSGDLIDNPDRRGYDAVEISSALKKIKAEYGKFAVAGNHEHRYKLIGEYRKILSNSDFIFLKNKSVFIDKLNINIIGCDNSSHETRANGKKIIPKHCPNLENIRKCRKLTMENTFNILITHQPDVADEMRDSSVQLALAGHSHGGQVRLPFVRKIHPTKLAAKYPYGIRKTASGAIIHTSEGIGATRLPFRFCCPPNLGIISIRDK